MNKILIGSIALLLIFTTSAYARSGCCSHHGGVCGCGCCDGSSLSNTCAPYYPECSEQTPTPTYAPVYTPTPTDTPTLAPTASVTVLETRSTNSDESGGIVTLALLGGLGFGGYKLAKRLLG